MCLLAYCLHYKISDVVSGQVHYDPAAVAMGVLLRKIYVQLFTREDKFNFHKTLDFACLLSYVVRFAHVGPRDMLFGADGGTAVTIAVHTLLSVSSLVFRIPTKRIAGGYRIWPEYRLHSIIFACRSLAGMALTWYELRSVSYTHLTLPTKA